MTVVLSSDAIAASNTLYLGAPLLPYRIRRRKKVHLRLEPSSPGLTASRKRNPQRACRKRIGLWDAHTGSVDATKAGARKPD